MSFDYADFERAKKSSDATRGIEHRTRTLRQIRQGAVLAEQITGDSRWDTFISILQGEIEALRGIEKSHQEQALSATAMPTWKRDGHRVEALRVAAAIDALERVQKLPAMLDEDGKEAANILKEIETLGRA